MAPKRTPEEIRAAAAERKARKEPEQSPGMLTAVAISNAQKAELLADITEVDLQRLIEHGASLSFGIGRDAHSQPCGVLTWNATNPPITVMHPIPNTELHPSAAIVDSLAEFFAELEAYLSRVGDPRRIPRAFCRTYPDPEREENERAPAYPSNLARVLSHPDDPTHPSNIRTGSGFDVPLTGVPLSNRDRRPPSAKEG